VREGWRVGIIVEFYRRWAWLMRPVMAMRRCWAEAVHTVAGETVIETRRDLIGRVSPLLF